MADIFDQASERETQDREAAIRAQLRTPQQYLKAEGYCLACFEDFPANDNSRLFCGPDCATTHSRRQASK